MFCDGIGTIALGRFSVGSGKAYNGFIRVHKKGGNMFHFRGLLGLFSIRKMSPYYKFGIYKTINFKGNICISEVIGVGIGT